MLKMAKIKAGETIIDLGAGDGRIVIWAALRYKAHAIGVEIDPLRCAWANFLIRLLGLRSRAFVHYGSMYDFEGLHRADIITLYLLQSTNQRIRQKLENECKPGTRIISRTFTFPQWQLQVHDLKKNLFLYLVQKGNQ
jgi:ribosomal protein L11 methylase PrmA